MEDKKMIRWEIEDAVNGYRLNISREIHKPIYKENTETYLESLRIVRLSIENEIKIEQQKLEDATRQIH